MTHTNAHASPAAVVTERMWQSLFWIAEREGESAVGVIDSGFATLLDAISDGMDLSDLDPDLENEWIPDEYLDGEFDTAADVRAYLDTLPIDWRLDAFMVVGDILADFTEP